MESISMGPRYSSSWMFPSPLVKEPAERQPRKALSGQQGSFYGLRFHKVKPLAVQSGPAEREEERPIPKPAIDSSVNNDNQMQRIMSMEHPPSLACDVLALPPSAWSSGSDHISSEARLVQGGLTDGGLTNLQRSPPKPTEPPAGVPRGPACPPVNQATSSANYSPGSLLWPAVAVAGPGTPRPRVFVPGCGGAGLPDTFHSSSPRARLLHANPEHIGSLALASYRSPAHRNHIKPRLMYYVKFSCDLPGEANKLQRALDENDLKALNIECAPATLCITLCSQRGQEARASLCQLVALIQRPQHPLDVHPVLPDTR
ncbi:unnamed protein product [Gadus morhua 'NCC']